MTAFGKGPADWEGKEEKEGGGRVPGKDAAGAPERRQRQREVEKEEDGQKKKNLCCLCCSRCSCPRRRGRRPARQEGPAPASPQRAREARPQGLARNNDNKKLEKNIQAQATARS